MRNRTTSVRTGRTISVIAQESLGYQIPPSTGSAALDQYIYGWTRKGNVVIAGKPETGAEALVLTLAEKFAANGGHVIWIGTTADMGRMCEQLMFKIAGLELPSVGTRVQLDAIAQIKLVYAREQIGKLWIDFCNVDDCGDTDVEQEFLASMSTFKPTLIVVDESIFDEATLNPFEVLVRQTHALRMVEELRGTNPTSSVLWHLPMSHTVVDVGVTTQLPSLGDLPDAASSIKPEVVLFTHRKADSTSKHSAELFIAANAFGPTGTLPMVFDTKHLTWHELDAAA